MLGADEMQDGFAKQIYRVVRYMLVSRVHFAFWCGRLLEPSIMVDQVRMGSGCVCRRLFIYLRSLGRAQVRVGSSPGENSGPKRYQGQSLRNENLQSRPALDLHPDTPEMLPTMVYMNLYI